MADVQHHALVESIARSLRRRCGVGEGDRIVVAVSGGADSVALLRAMALLAGRRTWQLELAVGHVQHHLREDAEDDAAFVEALADRLDLPFLRADLDLSAPSAPGFAGGSSAAVHDPPAKPRAEGKNLEARARARRYTALAAMAETFDAPLIATAHHADDQLETLLMRLLRGASVKGLRGIAWRRTLGHERRLIRPMLAADRADAVDFLNQLGQDWRQDHTNDDVTRLRARLRRDVLPILRDIRPDAARRSVALTDHLRHVHRVIETEIDRHHEHVGRGGQAKVLDRGEARQMNVVVLTGLLRRLLVDAGVPGDRLMNRTLNPIVRAIRDDAGMERSFDLAGAVRVSITRNEITITQ